MKTITAQPLSAANFAAYGDVIEVCGEPDFMINNDICQRYHDLAQLDFAAPGRAGISLFNSQACRLPLQLDLVERHPLGSQAFIPMSMNPFLIVVAQDDNGIPGQVEAFLSRAGQGINFHRGTWHGTLTPLHEPGLFAVVDRIGAGNNLELHTFTDPYLIVAD